MMGALHEKNNFAHTVEEGLPPPSYEVSQRDVYSTLHSPEASFSESTASSANPHRVVSSSFKPIVIPQTSKSFRGAFFSPFTRAYSPSLATHHISPRDFCLFVDGLNEAFIAAPAFQIANMVGSVMGFVPLHPVQWAGAGLSVGAGAASAATSWARARSYVRAANEEVFGPRGLKCRVLKTGKMMSAVGQVGERLELPPLEGGEERRDERAGGKDDPRMRRLRALGDNVAPLVFTGLPEPEAMENWWKKMGSEAAQKKDAKMQKKLMKERQKGWEEYEKQMEKVEKETRKGDEEIAKIEREEAKEIAKAEKKLQSKKGQEPKERVKIQEELEHELKKIRKEMQKALREKEKKVDKEMKDGQKESGKADEKEQEIAQKIYWIVIDKAERVEQEFGVQDDVEDLSESSEINSQKERY